MIPAPPSTERSTVGLASLCCKDDAEKVDEAMQSFHVDVAVDIDAWKPADRRVMDGSLAIVDFGQYNIDMKPVSMLDNVKIASPCSAKWEEMEGDERRRFCSLCRKHVHNIEGMSREEAEALVAGPYKVCLRMYTRADGTVLTADCPVGKRRVIVRNALIYGAAAIAAEALILIVDNFPGLPLHALIQGIVDRLQDLIPGQHAMGSVQSNITTSS